MFELNIQFIIIIICFLNSVRFCCWFVNVMVRTYITAFEMSYHKPTINCHFLFLQKEDVTLLLRQIMIYHILRRCPVMRIKPSIWKCCLLCKESWPNNSQIVNEGSVSGSTPPFSSTQNELTNRCAALTLYGFLLGMRIFHVELHDETHSTCDAE